MHWDKKTKGPQIPANCITPLQFYILFFASVLKKDTDETNAYAKEKIVNKT
jgi:hypothetical protein